MKKLFILTACILLALGVMLSGCIQPPIKVEDKNNLDSNTSNLDANSFNSDNNSAQYTNLEMFRKAKIGDTVSVHYLGKLEDGNVFDSSIGKDPLTFKIGSGQLIEGFDKGVIGMKIGETKTLTILPEQGYGGIAYVDANRFNDVNQIVVGSLFAAGDYEIVVVSVDGNTIGITNNHPLAGKTLIFEVQLVSFN